MSSGLQNIYKVAFTPLFFFSGVVLLFFPCISLLLVYSNFGQASIYEIKEYNKKCDNRICWNCRFKIQCRKNGQKSVYFHHGKKMHSKLKKRKKRGEHYFWFLMSSSISVISHPVPVVCVMNGRLRFTSKWNWMSRLCRIAINLREKKAKW